MLIKKIITAAVLLSMGMSASAQSLADAARKEKERRESVKTKTSAPVTNSDLSKVKRTVAVAEVKSELAEKNPNEAENPDKVSAPTAVGAPETSGPDPALAAEARRDAEIGKADLQDKWERAKERLDLLNLKMKALQQQFFTFNSMTTKDQTQRELAETNLKLQAAVIEEARTKKELDQSPVPKAKASIK